MATENIMMDAVKLGGDRQELHEKIRMHSMAAARVVKEQGGKNDLIDRIAADPAFKLSIDDLNKILAPKNFIGRAPEQVKEYISEYVKPLLDENIDLVDKAELNV